MRQWPVGLFDGRVSHSSRIFSGGKSAIDLIGIRGKTLVLIELKKEGNNKVGAISELLFYSSVMRDLLRGKFRFEDRSSDEDCPLTRDDIANCSEIAAVLLAPSIHPLLSDPKIAAKLNLAAAHRWSDLPIRFEVVEIVSPKVVGEDFVFSHAADDRLTVQ
jgi:Holliday junction resolvase-like predicted endonuclease